MWESFTIRKILGFRDRQLTDYFDDLELSSVVPRLLQYVHANAESTNVVWIVREEFDRLRSQTFHAAQAEPEQSLYRELKVQAVNPVSDEDLGRCFNSIRTDQPDGDSGSILTVDDQCHILLPIRTVKEQEHLAYILLMGVNPNRAGKIKRRMSRDLGYMAKHISFSMKHWQAQRLAFLDDLTSLYNQKYMAQVLESEIHRAQRSGEKFSVLFMDVDFFKSVNDTRGHWVGSRLLVEVGRSLKNHIRRSDYAFRYGGDEFVVVLPGTSSDQAVIAAERIRSVVESTEFAVDGEVVKLTLSIGLATYPDHAKTYKDIIKMADEAMYCGKHKSRNIVYVAS